MIPSIPRIPSVLNMFKTLVAAVQSFPIVLRVPRLYYEFPECTASLQEVGTTLSRVGRVLTRSPAREGRTGLLFQCERG